MHHSPSIHHDEITLTGLSIVFFNFLTLLYYDPVYLVENDVAPGKGSGAAVGPPHWVYYTLFAHQSLDPVDGKQAGRTGMAGPLGEMFDHGCDAINTTLEVVLASRALGLGRSWWTVASHAATLVNFYLTTWEEWHTGELYLGYLSGPVEGILMIVAIFTISGYYSLQFWDQRFFTFHLEHIPLISKLPNIPLNDSFMVFGALGLLFNIASSYMNVRAATKSTTTTTTTTNTSTIAATHSNDPATRTSPLLLLLPFIFSAGIQVAWLAHPRWTDSYILDSAAFVPFLCAWELQFAHMLRRMIMAHVAKQAFPVWERVWVRSVAGAVDAHLPSLLGRPPLIQTSVRNLAIFVYVTLFISAFTYARFVTLVIGDITDYLGIACFTVREQNASGESVHVVPERAGEARKAE